MKILKSHFSYNKRQRNGIFFLILLIILLQIGYYLIDFSPSQIVINNTKEMNSFIKEMDSLEKLKEALNSPKRHPFNPNYITDYKGYQLGLSTTEIDKLFKYRAAGNFINSEKQFQQITGVNDSLLKKISPYFKFPEWVSKGNNIINKNNAIISDVKKDINMATLEDLKLINGIGDKLAERIISYRTKLKGFSLNDQLYEVWYLDIEIANKVLERFIVIKEPIIPKININKATFKEALSIPYLDYELTKKIFEYRDEVAEIQSIDELKKIDGFPLEKFNRIALYLQAN
jgi:DNA uptake protein ComE-like DNA-binding protein